jgi:hypothetical protein
VATTATTRAFRFYEDYYSYHQGGDHDVDTNYNHGEAATATATATATHPRRLGSPGDGDAGDVVSAT